MPCTKGEHRVESLAGLCRLDKGHTERATETLVHAFMEDPLYAALIPDRNKRRNFLLPLFRLRYRFGLRYGEVWAISPNVEGIAIWFPARGFNVSFLRLLRCGGFPLLFGWKGRIMRQLMGTLPTLSPALDPVTAGDFMILAPVAVHPDHWGKGHASALIRPMLARLDTEGIPCWLATQNERDVSIYRHFGFQIAKQGLLPTIGLPYWTMERSAPVR
jgi:GNAT superfamily N-acetyltransferase